MIRAVALVALAAVACGGKSDDPGPLADELAQGLSAAIAAADRDRRPVLCAQLTNDTTTAEHALEDGSSLSRKGDTLSVELAGDRQAKIAIVADARQTSSAVMGVIAALVAEWERDDVSVVVALGGMERGDLLEVLAPLASRNRALIAAPGDREDVAELNRAVTTLRERGLPVFATNEIRLITIEGATLSVFPGVASESGLVAGGDGCLHREEDAAALAEKLAASPGAKVWLSYAPPRQMGASASDLSEGTHAGEREQATAIARARPQLVFHGQIESAKQAPPSGQVDVKATTTAMIAVGSIETLPTRPHRDAIGVILSLRPDKLSWRRTSAAALDR